MVERQVASAYIEREINRRQRSVDFDTRFDAFTSVLDAGGPTLRWVAAVAVPDAPLPRPHALTLAKANGIVSRAWQSPLSGGSFGPCHLTQNEPTRQGLRRFIRSARRDILAAPSAVAQARVEVHGDGTVAVAFTRDGAIPRQGRQLSQLPVDDLEQTALDCFALLTGGQRRLLRPDDGLSTHPDLPAPGPTELGPNRRHQLPQQPKGVGGSILIRTGWHTAATQRDVTIRHE